MSKTATITVNNRGGYLARFFVQFDQGGQSGIVRSSGNFALRGTRSIDIPGDATNIHAWAEFRGLFKWHRINSTFMEAPETRYYVLKGLASRESAKWELVNVTAPDPKPTYAPPIEHVIVLMLENRSFDHMLGFLDHPNSKFRRLRPGEFPNQESSAGPEIGVSDDAEYTIFGPDHSHRGVMQQLYGQGDFGKDDRPGRPDSSGNRPESTNRGFVRNYQFHKNDDPTPSGHVMRCFHPDNIPVMASLAKQYAVCTRWHASVPGQTWPNRDFAIAGSSFGFVDIHPVQRLLRRRANLTNKTVFSELTAVRKQWAVYHHEIPHTYLFHGFKSLISYRNHFKELDDLLADITCHGGKDGDGKPRRLPNFCWVEPDYGLNYLGDDDFGNSQHPEQASSAQEFLAGEKLMASIHNALLATLKNAEKPEESLFAKTLFVITYDEHGGFFDHEHPPRTVPPHDAIYKDGNYEFDFSVLGVRVPALVISPWIKPGTLIDDVMDHTSIMASLKGIFGSEPVDDRAQQANKFWRGDDETWVEEMLTSEPRNDLQDVIPRTSVAAGTPLARRDSKLAAFHYQLALDIEREWQTGEGGLVSLASMPVDADPMMDAALPSRAEVTALVDRVKSAIHAPSGRVVTIVDFAGYTYTEWQDQPIDGHSYDESEQFFSDLADLGPVEITDDQHRRLVLTAETGHMLFTEPGQPDRVSNKKVEKADMAMLFKAFRMGRLDILRAMTSLVPVS